MASSAFEPLRVHPTFEDEFPDGNTLATECFLNLMVAVQQINLVSGELMKTYDVTSTAAANVLTVLHGATEALLPSVLADRMFVTRATMTGLIDSLERRGLVARDVDEVDSRRRRIAITERGREIVDAMLPHLHVVEAQMFDCFDDREKRQFLRLITRLGAQLQTVVP